MSLLPVSETEPAIPSVPPWMSKVAAEASMNRPPPGRLMTSDCSSGRFAERTGVPVPLPSPNTRPPVPSWVTSVMPTVPSTMVVGPARSFKPERFSVPTPRLTRPSVPLMPPMVPVRFSVPAATSSVTSDSKAMMSCASVSVPPPRSTASTGAVPPLLPKMIAPLPSWFESLMASVPAAMAVNPL